MLKLNLQIATHLRVPAYSRGRLVAEKGTRVLVDLLALRWWGPTGAYIAVHVTEPMALRGWRDAWYFDLWRPRTKIEHRPEPEDAPTA